MNAYLCLGASKGALDMLTKVMGLELGPHKVCCTELNSVITRLPPLTCTCNVDSSEQCESYCGDDGYGEVGLVRP